VSTAGLGMSNERMDVIDFTVGLSKNKVGIIIENRGAVVLNIWVFVEVFLSTLWAGIASVMIAIMVAFFAIHLVTGERLHYKVIMLFSISNAWLNIQ
jgi:hypothetical protein